MSMDTTSSILVVWDSNTENRFSGYITEILLIEGYNWFEIHDLSREPLSPQTLARYQVAILTHIDLADEVQDVLVEFVTVSYTHLTLPTNREV